MPDETNVVQDATPVVSEVKDSFGNSPLEFIDTAPVVKDEPKNDPPKEVTPEPKPETKDSVFTKLVKKVFGGADDKKEPVNNNEKQLEEDISTKFSEIAKKAGWTDDAIQELASTHTNKELEDLIPFIMEEEGKKPEEKKPEKEPEKKVEPTDVKIDEKILKPYLDEIRKQLATEYEEKINSIQERLKAVDTDKAIQVKQQYQTTADNFFDKVAKDFPVFGKTEELLRFPANSPKAGQIIPSGPAFDARNAVYKAALSFHQMGESWDKSLEEALAWYKGKNLESEVRSKVLKDLKKNEKRVSPKRTEHTDTRDIKTRNDLLDELSRRAGIQ